MPLGPRYLALDCCGARTRTWITRARISCATITLPRINIRMCLFVKAIRILYPQIFSNGDEAGENSQADAGDELD